MKRLLDLSHHNLQQDLGEKYDYQTVADNYDAVILKCTDPEILQYTPNGIDPTYSYSHDGFTNVGLPVANYIFHDPSDSVEHQFDLFEQYRKPGFIDVLDVEDSEWFSNHELTQHVVWCLQEGRERLGRKMWLYSNLDFLNNRLIYPVQIAAEIAGIWLAYPSPSSSTFPKPAHYAKAAVGIWQKDWWHNAAGVPDSTVDLNYWQWSDDQWDEIVEGNAPTPPPTPVPTPDIDIEVIVPEGVNVEVTLKE
jgi:hypothetical protein